MMYDNRKKANEIFESIDKIEEEIRDLDRIIKFANYKKFVTINGINICVSSSFLTSERTALIIKVEKLKRIIETL